MYLRDKEIVCISTSNWDFPYGSRQQIMTRLANNNRILYVEAQISLLHILKDPFNGLKRIEKSLKGTSRKKNSLYIYTPLPLIPFGNFFFYINTINQFILLFFLKKQMKKIGFKRPILWIYPPNSFSLIGKMGEVLSIYYCIDDFPTEIDQKRRKRTLSFFENEILRKADLVFTCTKSLYEKRKRVREDIFFLRNGVDFDFFNKKDHLEVPSDISNICYPRIGFLGTMDSRIDVSLISSIASERPGWQIILIGKDMLHKEDRNALNFHSNIHMLGFRKYELLPKYIHMMDVCIIPYKTEGFSGCVFPIKVLEYLASGKPVVSTFLPELYDFQDVVKLSNNQEEFIENIDMYLKNNNELSRRREVAAAHSWTEKVNTLSELICSRITNKYN